MIFLTLDFWRLFLQKGNAFRREFHKFLSDSMMSFCKFSVNFLRLLQKFFRRKKDKMKINTTPEVDAIGQLNFSGNVIPPIWFKKIKLQTGKADLLSINILSEIVYWYRPSYVRDESSGQIILVNKKFKSDALQKSKDDLAEQFGVSERQVRESLGRLENLGLIQREFRTIPTEFGMISNVQFILINPKKIKEITYQFKELESESDVTPYGENPLGGQEKEIGCDENPLGGCTKIRQAHIYNTKTTTENTIIPLNPLKGRAAKAACVSDSTTYVKFFGSFVRLKNGEYESLCEKYSKSQVDAVIEEMNDYCAASKPKGYLDYAAAIRQWIRKRKQNPSQSTYTKDPTVDRRTKDMHGNPMKSPYDGIF